MQTLLYDGAMPKDNRIASMIYWNSEEEKAEAQRKAEERDESLSSFLRKLVKRVPSKTL